MLTQLLNPFQMAPRSMTLWPWPFTQLRKPFQMAPRSTTLWLRLWPFTYISENFLNLSIWVWVLIFHMCIPCDEAFLFIPNFWPNDFDLLPTLCLSLNFPHNFWTIGGRAFIIWHVFSTNETLSNDTVVNYLDLDLNSKNNNFLDFLPPGGICVSQTHLLLFPFESKKMQVVFHTFYT